MALKLAIKKKKKQTFTKSATTHLSLHWVTCSCNVSKNTRDRSQHIIWVKHFYEHLLCARGFPGGSVVKNPPAMQKTWLQLLVQKDALEKGMATLSLLVFFPGKSHGQRSLEGCSPWGHKRIGHDLVTKQQQHVHICMYIWIYTQKIKAGPKKSNKKDFCPQNSWLVLYSLQFPAGLVKVSTSTSDALILCST